MQISKKEAYSYRDDPAVPGFDDSGPLAVMDGECVLCSALARSIARLDRKNEFRICPVQTQTGRALLEHYGLDPDNPESWLFLADGKAYTSLDGIIRAGARIGGVGLSLQPLRVLPRSAQDWLYRRIARNRYSVLGRTEMCAIPDAKLRARLME